MPEKPWKVIGRYRPSTKDPAKIGEHLVKLTAELGYTPGPQQDGPRPYLFADWKSRFKDLAEVRHRLPDASNLGDSHWHQDGSGTKGMILWSSAQPTELRWVGWDGSGGKWITETPNAYDVILVNNSKCDHRAQYPITKERFFFRQYVEEIS
jgi:hypothetical protein